jgi:hypothetical protein
VGEFWGELEVDFYSKISSRKTPFVTFPANFWIPIIFCNFNSNCSNILELRDLRNKLKKHSFSKNWSDPFNVWINCSSDLKNIFVFYGDLKAPKGHFEINWPLKIQILNGLWFEGAIRYKSDEILASLWRLCFKRCPNIHYTIRIALILKNHREYQKFTI